MSCCNWTKSRASLRSVWPMAWAAAVLMLTLGHPGPMAAAEPQVREVVVAFKTHFDIGYTDLARNIVQRYRTTMIDQALRVVDQSRTLPPEQQFVWTVPGWPLSKIMEDWPGQTPQRKQRLEQAFREGRFAVHALPFSTHTELLELEDLVRGLEFASRVSQAASLPLPRDAKMTDVACHAWIMPTLLKHAGVDFLHLGCNEGVHPVEVPALFWWEGPDGSRLLTMYSHGYGTGLVPPKGWPHKTWLALIHTGDNHGPPTPEEVKKLANEAAKRLPGVKVRIGRLSDFADAILAEKPDLPVIRRDMPDTWIHGLMANPDGARLARNTRPLIAATEALNTQLRAWGMPAPDAARTIAAAYEQSLLYGEHTWGGALYWVTQYSGNVKYYYGEAWKKANAEGRFKRLEESWDEHTQYIRSASNLIAPVLSGGLKSLAGAVDMAGDRIVVYNPLPWRRDGLVRLADAGSTIKALKPADGGEPIATAMDGKDLVFLARDVPPCGYRTFVPAAEAPPAASLEADASAATMESPLLKIVFDPAKGTIRSLVDAGAAQGFGQYLYERFDANNVAEFTKAYLVTKADWAMNEVGKPNLPSASEKPYRAVSPKFDGMRVQQSPFSLTAIFHAEPTADLPHGVTTKVTVYAGLPCVDLEITLHQKPADPWPEAGWLCMPFAVESPRFLLGRQASIIDPAKDVMRGANRHLFGITSGVAMLGPNDQGVGLCALDNPLISLDRPGGWKYSLDFVPQKPVAYVNLFNNQWTTNFRMWNEGTWTSRVRVWAIDRYDAEASLITPSLEARSPLLAARAEGTPGKTVLSATQPGLELARRGIMVTAFGPSAGVSGAVLRLWELAGRSGECVVHLPRGMRPRSVQPLDLRGRAAGQAIPCQDGAFSAPLSAFAPASFAIQ